MSGFDSSRRRPRGGLRLAVVVLLLVTASIGAASASVLILPLGDSITHGGDGDGGVLYPTYRAWLYQDLRTLGYDVDFVGSLDRPVAPAGTDPDNEGHPAYTSGQILAELPTWLEAYPAPQIALVHLGTNDAIQDIPPAQTIADLQGIIAALRARNPSMTILVAQIIPTSVASTNTRIEALNREIAGLAALATPQSPIVVVDLYSGYDGDADNQKGGVHPLTSGEKKMAYRWESALLPVLARGVAPAVTPAPITTPATVTLEPTVPAIATPTTTPRFGSRTYLVGQVPVRTVSANTVSTGIAARSSRLTAAAQGATTLTPPATPFRRWYPATRWSAGVR